MCATLPMPAARHYHSLKYLETRHVNLASRYTLEVDSSYSKAQVRSWVNTRMKEMGRSPTALGQLSSYPLECGPDPDDIVER